ncbi:MAG: acyl-ACP--UDP-N-acetylglucosamine O-acyltransferase [Planctomycetota bacterium]
MNKIHANATIDKQANLGENIVIGPNCVIEKGTQIGDGCCLDANVVIGKNVQIGVSNQFFANAVIGKAPQLLGTDPNGEFGKLIIGDNNIIREQVTIHPSMYLDKATIIGNENLLMIGVHIGHDCRLEDKIVISNYSQISGHCDIHMGVWLSGMVAVHQFVTFGRWCYATGLAGINHDVPPFVIVSGHYPPEIRAVNKRGLQRAGMSEQQQVRIMEAFRRIFRDEGPVLENAKRVASQDGLDENVMDMVEAIIRSSQHRFGRYLEQFRH